MFSSFYRKRVFRMMLADNLFHAVHAFE